MAVFLTVGKFFGGLIFAFAFGTLIAVMVIAQFTEYENLQPILTNILAGELRKQMTAEQFSAIQTQCADGRESIEIPFDKPVGTTELKCADVKASDYAGFPQVLGKAIFDKLYYKQYQCSFLECIQTLQGNERYAVITTSLGNKFFVSMIIPLAVATILGAVLLIVSIRTWHGIAKYIGISCLFIGLPYFTFPIIETMLTNFAPAEQISAIQPALAKIFDPMKMNFLIIFVAGMLLTTAGYIGEYMAKKSGKEFKEVKKVAEEKKK